MNDHKDIMECRSWHCDVLRRPGSCSEEEFDVLIIGAGIGGLAAARELSRYDLKVGIVNEGPLGGHHALDRQPTVTDETAASIVERYRTEDVIRGVFDGEVVVSGDRCIRPRYRHLILNTGGLEMYTPIPGSPKVVPASEALMGEPGGRRLLVWGTTEWGLRTAMALAERGHDVVVADNSAYLRDVRYYQKVRDRLQKLGIEVIHSAIAKRFKDGVMELSVNLGKRGWERRSLKIDRVVSAVRTVNIYVPLRLGLKVFYSFELNSLVPRRNSFGEILMLDGKGKSAGGSNIYATGELYGATYAHIEEAQGRLLAVYLASKMGREDPDKAAKALEDFRARIALEANWLYNLDLRLSRGTDYTDLYVEPNVIDVPGWPYFWPNGLDEIDGDQIVCPCTGLKISDVIKIVERINKGRVEIKVTSDSVNKLRHIKIPTLAELGGGPSPCFETLCVPNLAIIIGAIFAQKPSYVLYGKPKQLYESAL